jgi:DNA-binding NarL/FixJ family response regulator
MIKTVIAHDHPIVRAGLKQIQAEAPDIKVAGYQGCSRSIIKKIRLSILHLLRIGRIHSCGCQILLYREQSPLVPGLQLQHAVVIIQNTATMSDADITNSKLP